jgi:hypothetical protein
VKLALTPTNLGAGKAVIIPVHVLVTALTILSLPCYKATIQE